MAVETFSATWAAVSEWARDEIEEARDNIEEYEDEALRGRIRALRDLLALGEPTAEKENTSVVYSD